MEKLIVTRSRVNAYRQTTILKDCEGRVKKIYDKMLNQPRKNQKTVVINNKTFCLDWSKVK